MKKDEMKMKNWRQLNLTQRSILSFSFFPLSLSLSLDLEAPCSLSVWSLLACKLHWLPRCTFLSFFPTASLPVSPSLFLRFATLFFAYSFDLLAFCLALCARHFFVFSTYFTQCKSPLFQHFFSVSLSISLAVYCLPAFLFPIVSPFSTFLTLDVFMYPPWVALGWG